LFSNTIPALPTWIRWLNAVTMNWIIFRAIDSFTFSNKAPY
jgi:hypothetical protein